MKHFPIYIASVLLLASCSFGEHHNVDFTEWPDNPEWFQVTSQRTQCPADGLPVDCYMLGGTPINEYNEELPEDSASVSGGMLRTSSVTATSVIQNLLDHRNRKKVIELSGTYWSTDSEGNRVKLSGKVVLPAEEEVSHIILVSHYTIGSNAEAPSNAFPLEAILAQYGYAMIFPDYLGYGITADQFHPYLVMDVTARNVADMYFSVYSFLKAAGKVPHYRDIYLMGYSQGGATTMAVERLFETEYADSVLIRRVFAGGGPYDVLATYDRFVSTDVAGYPVAVPLVMQGMIRGNKLNLDMHSLVQPFVAENLDAWVNSKSLATAQINKLIGTHVTHEILSAKGMDRTSAEVSELYKAMTDNSILSYNWYPQSPVYMFHSMDDEVVTFANASRARAKWTSANIKYNFGHYGTHIQGCLRFISSVAVLLVEDILDWQGEHFPNPDYHDTPDYDEPVD